MRYISNCLLIPHPPTQFPVCDRARQKKNNDSSKGQEFGHIKTQKAMITERWTLPLGQSQGGDQEGLWEEGGLVECEGNKTKLLVAK